MTESERTDIHIGLPTGEPSGIRVAEIPLRIVRSILVPKSIKNMLGDLKAILAPNDAEEHPECKAVYFLFGKPKENDLRPTVYVGLTDTPWERAADHLRKKKFDAVIVAVSTRGFSFDDVHWLEWYCLKQAWAANRFNVTNERRPDSLSSLNCKGRFEVFNTISILVSVLGFPLFELPEEQVVDDVPKDGTLGAVNEVFYCQGEDADATGMWVQDHFMVRKDSVARLRVAPHAVKTVGRKQKELLDEGVLVAIEGGKLRFTRDCVFTKPSPAASLVLGRAASGSVEWENEDGKPLGEIMQAGGKE